MSCTGALRLAAKTYGSWPRLSSSRTSPKVRISTPAKCSGKNWCKAKRTFMSLGLLEDDHILGLVHSPRDVFQNVEIFRVFVEDVFLRVIRVLIPLGEYALHSV